MRQRSELEIRIDLAQQLTQIVRKFEDQVQHDADLYLDDPVLATKYFKDWPFQLVQR